MTDETLPVVQAEPAVEPAPAAEAAPENFDGYPIVRFHPVHGRGEFANPNEYHKAGGDEGDWRFQSAFDSDRARTGLEAEMARLENMRQLLDAHRANGPVARNSAQAEESRATGYPEPGLN